SIAHSLNDAGWLFKRKPSGSISLSDFKEIPGLRKSLKQNGKMVELIRGEILIAKGLIHNPFCVLVSSNNPVFCISIYDLTFILKPNRKVFHSLSSDDSRDFHVPVPRQGV